ncbi:MAG: TlyA family RNA methyltransferase [Sandaracinaceae bacterium]|nr:TlyA family RNA methyltransferase [Sandaracinaceae bacterium]
MQKERMRIDQLLVVRGIAPTRERAQALLGAGEVYVQGKRVEKAGLRVPVNALIEVRHDPNPYVSRGGLKLEGAIRALGIDPKGWICADFGASTGGFTDCLLQHGAARVYAIDVGRGLLHPKLRQDPRVVVCDRTNARHLTASSLPEPMDLVTIDASFIGLAKLLPAARAVLRPPHSLQKGGKLLALIKPQFEVDPSALRKGIVKNDEARKQAIEKVVRASQEIGFEVHAVIDSVLRGADGNLEAFLWATLVA